VSSITKLRDFLLNNRKAYIGGFGQSDQLTDRERDGIDAESQKIIKLCSQSLLQLKAGWFLFLLIARSLY